jgi:hypothetical protein
MKSPSDASPSSPPTGASSDTGSWPSFRISSTFFAVISTSSPISSDVGSRLCFWISERFARATRFIRSTMCTGMRIVRDWSASARVIAWRIHQVA